MIYDIKITIYCLLFSCWSFSLFSWCLFSNFLFFCLYSRNLAFLFLSISFLISLLHLALLKTFVDGGAYNAEDEFDRLSCIIVCWDNEVNVAWVRVGVDDSEHRNAQTVSLAYCDVLLHHVNHEEG